MMNTTEHAAAIRATLKRRHGWSSRDVSVRADHFSMGSAIRVAIKNPDVPFDTVQGVANAAEDIRRDASGEILSGGNRYVTVSYDSDALRVIADRYISRVEDAIREVGTNSTALVDVAGTPYRVGRSYSGWGWSVWSDAGHQIDACDARNAAEFIGARMLRRTRCQ